MLLFGGENKLTVNRLPLIRQGKALPPSPRGEGLRQRSLPQGEDLTYGYNFNLTSIGSYTLATFPKGESKDNAA